MKKNYGSICCCKNHEWAESQSCPELPIATVNVASNVGMWRAALEERNNLHENTQNGYVALVGVIRVLPYQYILLTSEKPFSGWGWIPPRWRWLCGACSTEWGSFPRQGWQQHSPIPAHAHPTDAHPAAQCQSHNELRGTSVCALVATVCIIYSLLIAKLRQKQ